MKASTDGIVRNQIAMSTMIASTTIAPPAMRAGLMKGWTSKPPFFLFLEDVFTRAFLVQRREHGRPGRPPRLRTDDEMQTVRV